MAKKACSRGFLCEKGYSFFFILFFVIQKKVFKSLSSVAFQEQLNHTVMYATDCSFKAEHRMAKVHRLVGGDLCPHLSSKVIWSLSEHSRWFWVVCGLGSAPHGLCDCKQGACKEPRHVGVNSHGVFGREAVTASFFLLHSDASLSLYCGTFQPQDVLHIKSHFMSLTSTWKESLSVMTSLDPTLIYQLPPIGLNREPVEIQVLIIISALLCLKETGRIWNDVGRYVQRKTLVLIWWHTCCTAGFHLLQMAN